MLSKFINRTILQNVINSATMQNLNLKNISLEQQNRLYIKMASAYAGVHWQNETI